MVDIHPAATVLIVKEDFEKGIEVLLLKRNRTLKFAPDYWVFPGGRIDKEDGKLTEGSIEMAAKNAAVREAKEEAGLIIEAEQLDHFCHWTTPSGGNKRFSTWFFHSLFEGAGHKVNIDDGEIVDHMWVHPHEALNRLSAGQLHLLPPTFISLHRIREARNYRDVVNEFNRTGIVNAAPVTILRNNTFFCLYLGDAGYDTGDIYKGGSRHRLIINQSDGKYHFEYEGTEVPPVNGGVF